MSTRFIWNKGLSRIRYKLLMLPKPQSGVGLPDFELYHRAAVLARVLEWFPCPFSKASLMVEQDRSLVDLRTLLWVHRRNLHNLQSSPPLTLAVIKLWHNRGLQTLLSSDLSPLTSFFDNLEFPQGVGTPQ